MSLYDIGRDGVTRTLLAMFMSCRQSAKLYLDGLELKSDKPALRQGSVVHWLLEQHYKGELPSNDAAELRQYGDALFQKYCRLEKETPDQDLEVMWAKGLATIHGYSRFWKKRDANLRWVEAEHEFAVPYKVHEGTVAEWDVTLRGKTDGLMRAGKTGKSLWMLEHKTSSGINDGELSLRLNIDFQLLFYVLAIGRERGERVGGIHYNVIGLPQHRVKIGQTLRQYRDELFDVVTDNPTKYYHRYEIVFPKVEQDHFQHNLLDVVLEEFKMWLNGELLTYQQTNACVGRWACQYLRFCASHGDTAGYMTRDQLFKELSYGRAKIVKPRGATKAQSKGKGKGESGSKTSGGRKAHTKR